MPFLPKLFGIFSGGIPKVEYLPGILLDDKTSSKVPPLLRRRLRPFALPTGRQAQADLSDDKTEP